MTASLFTASPPIASCSHLGEHRFAIGDKEGLGWPTSLPSAIATALVRAWVPEGVIVAKTGCSEGLSIKWVTVGIVPSVLV